MRKSASLFAGLTLLALAACSTGEQEETFTVQLTGGNEVPPVATSATGTFQMTSGAGVARFTLTVNGLTNISAAHIHTNSTATTNTGVSVFLFDGPVTSATTAFNGTLNRSSFTQATVTAGAGAGAESTFDNVIGDVRGHTAYVNVHTDLAGVVDPCPPDCPGGAIRGNF